MATAEALAHIEGQRRIRVAVTQGLQRVWRSLPSYDEGNLSDWLRYALPLVQGGQRSSVALTRAYLARSLERPPAQIDVERLLADLRGGVSPSTVYTRPFVQLWSELGEGKPWQDATTAALARAEGAGAVDVQMAMRGTLTAVGAAEELWGYQRVADSGACEFCQELDGAQFLTEEPMPMHPHCGCGVEPVPYTRGRPTPIPAGVAVSEHGELGPVLGAAGGHFLDEPAAYAR